MTEQSVGGISLAVTNTSMLMPPEAQPDLLMANVAQVDTKKM